MINCPILFSKPENPEQSFQGIIESVHDSFFKRNNGVVCNGNIFGANLRTAFGDITITNPIHFFQILQTVFHIKRVHFKCSGINEESRTDEFIMKLVFTQHMTHVLAKEAFNTFTKFLDTVDIFLGHTPCPIRVIRFAGFKLLYLLLYSKIPGHISYQVFDQWKRLHRLQQHRFIQWQITEAGHAHQFRHPIDLSGTRATFPRLAIPPNSEVVCHLSLNTVYSVQYNHPFGNLNGIVFKPLIRRITAQYSECCYWHKFVYFISSMICLRSGLISLMGSFLNSMWPLPLFFNIRLNFPLCSSFCG